MALGRDAPEACVTNVETSDSSEAIAHWGSSARATRRRHPLVPRTARTIDLAVGRQETEASPVVGEVRSYPLRVIRT
jgi:hypothetical protein